MKRPVHVVLANGATAKDIPTRFRRGAKRLTLSYAAIDPRNANLEIGLPRFVADVNHLSARVLDLLEIAAYVFCADRWIGRGAKDLLEYNAWGRNVHHVVRVRDLSFWSTSRVIRLLEEAITWVTGDASQTFTFVGGHSTPAAGLFDSAEFALDPQAPTRVALFSGGIDSLTGAAEYLRAESGRLCLVSHRSSTDVQRTQQSLLSALQARAPGRITPYAFTCHLKGKRAEEETQRSRSFLFSAIAYALAAALKQNQFFIYENGVTSLNLPKREGMGLARASRTTHPRTLALFSSLLTEVHGGVFEIVTPYSWKTKAEVLMTLEATGCADLLDTSVSCTRTFDNTDNHTHCGSCSQCVDRRFSAVASGLGDRDHGGLYTTDIITADLDQREARTFVVDYLAQAYEFATAGADRFEAKYLSELADMVDYVNLSPRTERVAAIHALSRRHGAQVMGAIQFLNDPKMNIRPRTLLALINEREYLKTPIARLSEDLCARFTRSIPLMFQHQRPADENDFNDKIDGLLNAWKPEFEREHPSTSFARARVIPDHFDAGRGLVVESKYLRGSTTASKATDGLAADLMKLPPSVFKLFVVYDPDRSIADDTQFRAAFENKALCRVLVVR
jgi:7-cyano-7-deazaguanine synthase in queuosine biosynthesis